MSNQPTVGTIVRYIFRSPAGVVARPAIVTEVNGDNSLNLWVFLDGPMDGYNPAGGFWVPRISEQHPERTENCWQAI